ncbi:hypothetical protein BGX27_002683 [Mortierella sp. AM989]|nr:hypothetical protein BGX27_002683 [Mortierella sp. AM989]
MAVPGSKSRCALPVIVLALSLLAAFASNVVLAQSQHDTSPTSPSSPVVITTPTTVGILGQGTFLPPAPIPSSSLPNPIFTTSDACVACQKEYFSIHNCTSHLPPAGVNLTMIVQLLPFYGCFCQNNYVLIDALQQCSTCFRSTGQQAHLNTQFYNVTNQSVKAFKKVCVETANGSKVPTSGVDGMLDILMESGCWILISTLFVVLLPIAGSL